MSTECVERWPECHEGGYDPRCCRFPKSCSCEVTDTERTREHEVLAFTLLWEEAVGDMPVPEFRAMVSRVLAALDTLGWELREKADG